MSAGLRDTTTLHTSTQVKICGITSVEDALAARDAGADLIGLMFARSARQITREQAQRITGALGGSVKTVGVFLNASASEVREVLDECGIDLAQLHGEESPETAVSIGAERVWKAFRVQNHSTLERIPPYSGAVTAVLLDAFNPDRAGGTGDRFDWTLAAAAKHHALPIVLAGGLTPANVGGAIAQVRPFGVDVSTGVEAAPGCKDRVRMCGFVDAVREADRQLAGGESEG